VLLFLHQQQKDVCGPRWALCSVRAGLCCWPELFPWQRSLHGSTGAGRQQRARGCGALPQGSAGVRLLAMCRAGPLAAGRWHTPGVRPAVPEEVSLLAEALPTLGAVEGPLSGVGPLVNSQVHLLPEALATLGTGVRSLTSVALPVQLQLAVLLEGLPTERAGVRAAGVALQAGWCLARAWLALGPLHHVHTLVDPEGELALEALGAFQASEGLPARVGLLMGDEVGLLGEALAALGAGEGALPGVRAVMRHQVALLVEAAAADAAGEGPLTGVDALVSHQVGLQAEPLPADIAAIRTPAPVVLAVLYQTLILHKASPALGAQPGSPLHVLLLGRFGGQLISGALVVLRALVGLLPHVSLLVSNQGDPQAKAVAALIADEGLLRSGGGWCGGCAIPEDRLHPQVPQEVWARAEARSAASRSLRSGAMLRPEQSHLGAKPFPTLHAGEGLLPQRGLLCGQQLLL